VDHVTVAPERAEPPARDIASDGVHRHQGHTEPRHHGLLDGLGVAELHGRGHIDEHFGSIRRTVGC
jgi:hypothetical protein